MMIGRAAGFSHCPARGGADSIYWPALYFSPKVMRKRADGAMRMVLAAFPFRSRGAARCRYYPRLMCALLGRGGAELLRQQLCPPLTHDAQVRGRRLAVMSMIFAGLRIARSLLLVPSALNTMPMPRFSDRAVYRQLTARRKRMAKMAIVRSSRII